THTIRAPARGRGRSVCRTARTTRSELSSPLGCRVGCSGDARTLARRQVETKDHVTTLESVKAPPLEKQTTVGNYSVSNYPPFSFWKPEFVSELFAALDRPPSTINHQPSTPLGLYVHIPFCRKRCHFCYFKVYTDKDSSEIKAYIDAALAELALYASKPFIGGRKPNFIY